MEWVSDESDAKRSAGRPYLLRVETKRPWSNAAASIRFYIGYWDSGGCWLDIPYEPGVRVTHYMAIVLPKESDAA